ncbi:hypothetical protein TRICHSKD4_3028 [Roseibium sp. TrichSKD4]|uniref:hypothetical protein n=1 Tax=Roseibium sp. TrichSKD4 TaxID=744980 RepID=UPI0001E56A91|nr:hypothetical protein [Roseibium sp. TrichSKD4]EFO31933.1 hypothetical protein TRICHSKD4_3028 [Roseibium sp. TrichSKD4]
MTVEKPAGGIRSPFVTDTASVSKTKLSQLDSAVASSGVAHAQAKSPEAKGAWRSYLESTGVVKSEGAKSGTSGIKQTAADDVEISAAYDRASGRRYMVLDVASEK